MSRSGCSMPTPPVRANMKPRPAASHRSGDYVITTTRHYDVRRAGTTQIHGRAGGRLDQDADGYMDAIEPYDYRAFQPFSTAYLPGYRADKYDEDADTCRPAPTAGCGIRSAAASASITGYNSVSTLSENIHIDYTAKHYALLPVWMLHTKWQGKDYLFAMNGRPASWSAICRLISERWPPGLQASVFR